jgi:xanthine dehydrogenase YagT iron-sulfur-binding subunit
MLAEADRGWPSAVSADVADDSQLRADLSTEEVRERMSGNLCRCGAYPRIVDAIRQVAGAAESEVAR